MRKAFLSPLEKQRARWLVWPRTAKRCTVERARWIVFCLIGLMSLAGCRAYVPVETVRTEYRHTTDTIEKSDTVIKERETIIREANKGDSALLQKMGIRLSENERLLLLLQRELDRERSKEHAQSRDTVTVCDTIQVPYPVEGKVKAGEKAKLLSAGAACGVGATFIFLLLGLRWYRSIRDKG